MREIDKKQKHGRKQISHAAGCRINLDDLSVCMFSISKSQTNTLKEAKHETRADFFEKTKIKSQAVTLNKETGNGFLNSRRLNYHHQGEEGDKQSHHNT